MLESFVKAELEKMEKAIEQAPVRRMFNPTLTWVDGIPSEPGVYVIWDATSKKPIYVGETSSLKSRMKNIGRTKNHTFRRMVREKLNMTSDSETALSEEMSNLYEVSFIKVSFGRAELEEFLVKRWPTVWNKSAKNA